MHRSTLRAWAGAALCATLVGCSTKAERIESGLRKGTQYVRNSEWDKASIEARNVLQMDPKNAGAFLLSAQVEDGKGALRNAYADYAKVLELRPDSMEARLGLARLYLLSGDAAKGGALVAQVLAADPTNVRARTLDAAALSRQGRQDEARAEADDLAKSAQVLPVDASLALAGLYVNDHAPDAAIGVLDKSIAAYPKEVRLLQMAAEVAQSASSDATRSADAARYYGRATMLTPKDDGLWREWAAMHLRRRENAQAETVLRQAVQADPDDMARLIALLRFDAEFGDHAKAEQAYLDAAKAHPKESDLRFALADFYRSQGRTEDAVKTLQAIVDTSRDAPAGATARGQLAGIWMSTGKTAQARSTLAELLKANPRDATGLVLRSRIEIVDGDLSAAIADLRSADKDRPGSTEIAELLANAHHLAGEPQLAREALADAVKFNEADAHAHLMLAADMAETHEFDAAEPEVAAALKADPRSEAAWQMRLEIALARNDFAGAEGIATAMESRFPASPSGHLVHGRVLLREKKFGPALAQFDAAARIAPKDPEPRIAAVGLLTAQHQYALAAQRIDAIQQDTPGSALARQMRGELALATNDLPAAQDAFGQLADLPGAPVSTYKNLAAVMVARKNLDGALAVLSRGEMAYPNDVTLASARAEWLGRAGRMDEAIAVYEKLLARAPGSDIAANNLAYVLAETRHDKPSLDRALQLSTRFATSGQPRFVDTLGLVQYRLGNYAQAATVLGRAATLAPDDLGVQLHYGMALVKKGDRQQGADLLRKALARKVPLPDHDEAQALLTNS